MPTYDLVQNLFASYRDRIEAERAAQRLQGNQPPLSDDELRIERAIVEHQAISAIAFDEQYMGLSALYGAWELYRSGDWRDLPDEYDSFLDYMQNGLRRYTRSYREDLYRVIVRIFAWMNKPSTRVFLPSSSTLITIPMVFETCTVQRLRRLSYLFEVDDEAVKAKHLIWLVTQSEPDQDEQKAEDDNYLTGEEQNDPISLPVIEVERLDDGLLNLYMWQVTEEQFAYLQLSLPRIELRNYTGEAHAGAAEAERDDPEPVVTDVIF